MTTMRRLWWLAGLLLVVAGVVVVMVADPTSQDFGWIASTPIHGRLADYDHHCTSPCTGFSFGDGGLVLLGAGQLVGIGITGIGLLVLAGALGFTLGRRRRAA